MAMTHANLSTLINYHHLSFSTMWVTAHTLPIQPKERALPDSNPMKCAGFLGSIYSKLCHVTWRLTISCCAAWECNNPHGDCYLDRQPFVRIDVIANDVLPISDIWRSWKIVIYRLHRADLYGTKEYSGVKAAQFCGYILSILLSVRALQHQKKN